MRQDAYLQERRDKRKSEDTTPVGYRNAFAAHVRDLVEQRGDEVRNALADPEAVQEMIDALREGVRKRDRTCIIQWLKVMKMVDAELKVVHEFIMQMGAKTADELKRGFMAAKQAEGVDALTAIERCTAFLEGALPMHENHRAVIIRRLGGYLPVDSDHVSTDANPVAGA